MLSIVYYAMILKVTKFVLVASTWWKKIYALVVAQDTEREEFKSKLVCSQHSRLMYPSVTIARAMESLGWN